MVTNVPTSSNAATSADAPRPWSTTEVIVLTRCWMNINEGVTPIAPPHCLLGDELTRITCLFNHEMGEGQHRLKEDVTKWTELKEKVT